MIRKHKGIDQRSGKLKKGYKYSGKKLKSGLSIIVKVQKKTTKKKKNMVGGTIIGVGGFGCIIDYAILSDGKFDYDKISKITKALDRSEINMGKVLTKIDPQNKYFLYAEKVRRLMAFQFDAQDMRTCKHYLGNLDDGFVTTMKKADINLEELKTRYSVPVKTMIKIILKLLDCSDKLLDNGISHFDIKALNVMLIDKGGKYNVVMIDFGGDFNMKSWREYNIFSKYMSEQYFWPSEVWGSFRNYYNIPFEPILFKGKQTRLNFLRPFAEKVMVYMIGKIYENTSKRGIKGIIRKMMNEDYRKRPTIKETRAELHKLAKDLKIDVSDLHIKKTPKLTKGQKIKGMFMKK